MAITGCTNCPLYDVVLQGVHETYSASYCRHPKFDKGKFIEAELEGVIIKTPTFCPWNKYFK